MKRITVLLLCFFCVIAVTACGGTNESQKESQKVASLTDDETELLEILKDDINVITDDSYAETVIELMENPGEYSGKLYQIEGVFSVDEDTPYVSRYLIHNGQKTFCGLPLKYLQKDMEENDWVRVVGIVQEDELGGEKVNVLEVVAIEELPYAGNAEIKWSGSLQ